MSREEIRDRRIRLGLAQKDLAKIAGVSYATINRLENDEAYKPLHNLTLFLTLIIQRLEENYEKQLS